MVRLATEHGHPARRGPRPPRARTTSIKRYLCIVALLGSVQAVAPPAAALAWPELCARPDLAVEGEPDEVRRYRMFLNDQPAGRETYRFWHRDGGIWVIVETALDGDILAFPADFRHCRLERWHANADGLELQNLHSATRYAVPFKADYEIRIEQDEQGRIFYRGNSSLNDFEERHPANTGVISPWSIRTVAYDRLLDLFAQGTYPIETELVGRANVDGQEIRQYAVTGAVARHLWYGADGKMVRFCAAESFGIYVETIFEPYADHQVDALGLNRPCAEQFKERGTP